MSRTGMRGFDSAGMAIGEVYGVRWWTLRQETGPNPVPGRLSNFLPILNGAYGRWEPGDNQAVCSVGGRHSVPDEDCGCGFWAYWLPEAKSPLGTSKQRVLGVIKGWGDDTLIGEKGFRCARARIVALCCADMAQRRVMNAPPTFVEGPPPGVRFSRGPAAMETFRALGGRGTWHEDPSAPPRLEDDLLAQAELEYRLGEAYQCPVYTTFDGMLAMHPTTKDYLPPPPPPPLPPWQEELARMGMANPEGYQKAAKLLGDLMVEFTTNVTALGEATMSGTDALKRLALLTDFTIEMSGTFTLSDEEIIKMLGLPPGS